MIFVDQNKTGHKDIRRPTLISSKMHFLKTFYDFFRYPLNTVNKKQIKIFQFFKENFIILQCFIHLTIFPLFGR